MSVSNSANLSLSQFVPRVSMQDGETVLIRVMKLPSVLHPVNPVEQIHLLTRLNRSNNLVRHSENVEFLGQ